MHPLRLNIIMLIALNFLSENTLLIWLLWRTQKGMTKNLFLSLFCVCKGTYMHAGEFDILFKNKKKVILQTQQNLQNAHTIFRETKKRDSKEKKRRRIRIQPARLGLAHGWVFMHFNGGECMHSCRFYTFCSSPSSSSALPSSLH